MNLIDNPGFIFNCPHNFQSSASPAPPITSSRTTMSSPIPCAASAMRRTNLIPDVINCELPLDNRRSPGYRRVEPHVAGNRFYLFVGQHETGRYAKAHKHHSTAVLIVEGEGYTYTWPDALGPKPWQDGKADKILRQDYEPVGIVSAAPKMSSGDWFHQHFGTSKGPLRLVAWHGPNNHPALKAGRPGEKAWPTSGRSISTRAATRSPTTWRIRRSAPSSMRRCARKASQSRMNPAFYERPPAEGEDVPSDM